MPQKKQSSNSSSVSPSAESASDLSSFEQEFERLGTIVEGLEGGNLPLEQMLRLYEEGMILSEKLTVLLGEAELRVQKLSKVHEEMPSSDEDSLETFTLE